MFAIFWLCTLPSLFQTFVSLKHSMEIEHSRMIKAFFRLLKEMYGVLYGEKTLDSPLRALLQRSYLKSNTDCIFFSIPHPFAETRAVLCHVTRCAPYAILHPSGVTSGHSIFPSAPAPSILFFFSLKEYSHCFWITGYFYYFRTPFLYTFSFLFLFFFRWWTATLSIRGSEDLRGIRFWAQYNLRLFQNPPQFCSDITRQMLSDEFFELTGAINKNNRFRRTFWKVDSSFFIGSQKNIFPRSPTQNFLTQTFTDYMQKPDTCSDELLKWCVIEQFLPISDK